jgi:hypothetical protein
MFAVKHVHGCVTCCCQTPNPLPAHMGDIIGTNCNSSFQMAGSVGFGSCVNPLTSLPLGSLKRARARCSPAVPSVSRRLSLTSCCADSEGASDDWNKAMWAGQHPCPPVPIFRSLLRRSSNGSIVPGALSVSVSGSSDHLHLLLLEASTLWLNCHSRSCSSSLGSTSALLPLRLLCV